MKYNQIIISVDELWLKGANKHIFVSALKKNIRRAFKCINFTDYKYTTEGPKHIIRSEKGFTDEVFDALKKVTGIHNITPAIEVERDLAQAKQAAIRLIKDLAEKNQTFKVVTKRSSKTFPLDSMTISKDLGAEILKCYNHLKVDLKKPDFTVKVSVLKNHIYISTKKILCFGGLPVSTAGSMVTLLSGGIDSPVAAFQMAKRGVEQSFLFFHAYPFVGNEVIDKIFRLSEKIRPFLAYGPLNIVPYGDIQQKTAGLCPKGYQTLFFRIYMLKTAHIFAQHVKHQGIITGDALSQVASQTLTNINTVDQCLPKVTILRPLIGMNKIDIQNIAREIGTYETSIEPHDDACSLLAPKSPVTHANAKICLKFIEKYPLEDMICTALNKTKRLVKGSNGEMVECLPYKGIDFKQYF